MLELMLTRPKERILVEALQDIQYLVLDELHTYRGRQGADVALLVTSPQVNDILQKIFSSLELRRLCQLKEGWKSNNMPSVR